MQSHVFWGHSVEIDERMSGLCIGESGIYDLLLGGWIQARCNGSVPAWPGASVPRWSPHPSLWCCSSPSSSAGPTVWNSLRDELRNSESFDGFKRFL